MSGQITLDGEPLPVQVETKVTKKDIFTSDFYRISISEDDMEDLMESTEDDQNSIIIKKMKLHRTPPVQNMGKILRNEFYKLKKAILGGDTGAPDIPEQELLELTEPEPEPEPEDTEEAAKKEQEKEEMTQILGDLMQMDSGWEDYLINNFKPAMLTKIAAALHAQFSPDDLPQKIAFNTAVRIKGLKTKQSAAGRR